jgi:hypothetical protein
MKVSEQLRELERVADELGIRVSFEPMTGLVSGAGGLCRVKGEYRVIIDRRLRPPERVRLLADALGRFDTSAVEMPASIRSVLSGGAGSSADKQDVRQSA